MRERVDSLIVAIRDHVEAWPRGLSAAIITVSVCLVASVAAIQGLSGTAARDVYIAGSMPAFTTPDTFTIGFVHADKLQAWDVSGNIAHVRDGVVTVGTHQKRTHASVLSLRNADVGSSDYVELDPSKTQGGLSLTITRHANVTVTFSHDSTILTVNPQAAMSFEIQADAFKLPEVDRTAVRSGPDLYSPGTSSVAVTGTVLSADAKMIVRKRLMVTLPASTTLDLLSNGAATSPAALKTHTPFDLKDLIVTVASFPGSRDADLTLEAPTQIAFIPAGDVTFTSLRAIPQGPGEAGPHITATVVGNMTSLKQDGREVLPTRLSDLLNADPKTRGLYGAAALLAVFLGVTALKRAVDVLLKRILPDD
jgi:hypothetical protein